MAELVALAAQHIDSKIKERKTSAKVKKEINLLSSELKTLYKLMIDTEKTELSKSPNFQDWVKDMGKIAFEAEDEVDNLLLEPNFSPFRASSSSKTLPGLTARITEVKTKLDEQAKRSNTGAGAMSRERGSQAPQKHHLDGGDFVIGIDPQITKIVDLLTGKSNLNGGKLAIIGMGGSGKTNLARSVYNHNAVKTHFDDRRAWVSVTRGLDIPVMLIDILNQIHEQKKIARPANDKELQHDPNILVSQLNKLLNKKSCLIVLDGVCTWDLQSLHNFFICLIQGDDFASRAYTIVITSRQSPPRDANWYVHIPQCLTDEDSWTLLSKVASNSSKASLSDDYRSLGLKLMKKCHGLPVLPSAIMELGKQLKTKKSICEWQEVLDDKEGKAGRLIYSAVKEIRWLSYGELPCYLKPCFLYMGLFPEGAFVSAGTLIRLWIAEGFIGHLCHGEETLEVAGRRCLQELIDHAMVQIHQRTYSGKVKNVQIHGIMRNLALSKARELHFLTVAPHADAETSRRVAILLSPSSQSDNLPANNAHLRSLSLFEVLEQSSTTAGPTSERPTNKLTQKCSELEKLVKTYKLLRVLDIFGIKTTNGTLPKDLGNLVHLTYLRIRSTNIRQLPDSIGKLSNLLTLDYRVVTALPPNTKIQVPNVLWKLERLRHLYLPVEMSGSVEALKLHTLKDLITLWGVDGGNWMLKEMGKLSTALSKLFIHRISTIDQIQAVIGCRAMAESKKLYALALDWHKFEFNSIHDLHVHGNLKKLKLIGKAAGKSDNPELEFPSNLEKLELYNTHLERPVTMALLGRLALLKVLKLCKDSYVGSEWNCCKQIFPKLEELKLANLPKLEKWVLEEGAMPCLKKLSIFACSKLQRLPEELKLIQGLERLDIEQMPDDFLNRLGKEGEHYHIIKHIANKRFSYQY